MMEWGEGDERGWSGEKVMTAYTHVHLGSVAIMTKEMHEL